MTTTVQNNLLSSLVNKVEHFVENTVIAAEPSWLRGEKRKADILSQLLSESLHQNLWGLFYPTSHGGKVETLEDYILVAEQEGRSELAQPLFGCQSAVDAHMLANFAEPDIQDIFLKPMICAQAVPGYGMTEPDHPGSVPTLLKTRAQKKHNEWVINGKKWFICNAKQATFFTVVVCTDSDVHSDKAYSMLLVPADSDGCRVVRSLPVLGRDTGQGELSLNNVHIPLNYIIGAKGQGMALLKYRLKMGRLLRSMHWIGMAQRCFDLMGQRIYTNKSKAVNLGNKQLIKQLFFSTYQQITGAREMLRLAARQVDQQRLGTKHDITQPLLNRANVGTHVLCSTLVSSAKVACAHALYTAADAAMQVHGAEGLSDHTPLSCMFRAARATRIMDGADEALISSAGGELISHYRDHSRFEFSATDIGW